MNIMFVSLIFQFYLKDQVIDGHPDWNQQRKN